MTSRVEEYLFKPIILLHFHPFRYSLLTMELGDNPSLHKADQWRRLLEIAPIILWDAWKTDDDSIPNSPPGPIPSNSSRTIQQSRDRYSLYTAALLLRVAVQMLGTRQVLFSTVIRRRTGARLASSMVMQAREQQKC